MGGCGSADKGTMRINTDGPMASNIPHDALISIATEDLENAAKCPIEAVVNKFNSDVGDDLNSNPIWGDLSELMFEREQDQDYFIKDEVSLEKQGFTADLFNPDIVKKFISYLGDNYKSVQTKHGPFKIRPVEFKELLVDESKLEVRKLSKFNNIWYFGQWNTETDQPEGRGVAVYEDGSIYEGLWLQGMRHSSGRYIFTIDGNLAVYQGNWMGDSTDGCFGYFISPDGTKAKGRFEDKKLNGDGFELDKEGNSYRGEFENGIKKGKGLCKWADGNMYEGEFDNNKMAGKGLFTYKDGRTFEGDYLENKMHGEGKFSWKGGKVYTGGYQNNMKHGQGTFEWGDGQKFVGGWNCGKQHGEGVFTNKEGVDKKGKWNNGKLEKWLS